VGRWLFHRSCRPQLGETATVDAARSGRTQPPILGPPIRSRPGCIGSERIRAIGRRFLPFGEGRTALAAWVGCGAVCRGCDAMPAEEGKMGPAIRSGIGWDTMRGSGRWSEAWSGFRSAARGMWLQTALAIGAEGGEYRVGRGGDGGMGWEAESPHSATRRAMIGILAKHFSDKMVDLFQSGRGSRWICSNERKQ
jgi:hypothetical protein